MTFSIHYSSISMMIQLIGKLKYGQTVGDEIKNELIQLLDHEDYKFEFSRYKGRISEEEFIDYILHFPSLNEDLITNQDLKAHHNYYMYLFEHLDLFIEKEKELHRLFKQEIFEDQIKLALEGLPDDLKLPELKFIFTIGIGQSFGYVHGNGMHFDFLQLIKDKSLEDFLSTIAHEVHHVGMNVIYEGIDIQALPLEALFYLYFSGEGLAVKYCNNAEGVLSKSIYNGPKNIGLDSFTWDYLNNDFNQTMTEFKKTIKSIRDNVIGSIEELEAHLSGYWMSTYTKEQRDHEIPKLKHFRLYTFGNDIWGVIHDYFGKKVVFQTVKDPASFPSVFNQALEKLGRADLKI